MKISKIALTLSLVLFLISENAHISLATEKSVAFSSSDSNKTVIIEDYPDSEITSDINEVEEIEESVEITEPKEIGVFTEINEPEEPEETEKIESAPNADSYSEDDNSNNLPENLPDDFYTEFPTGGAIDITPPVDIESVSDGKKGLLRSTYLESSYITPHLPPLKKQSPYGTCWAFSTISLAEISLIKNNIMLDPDLSELHLAYFMYNSVTDPLGGTADDIISLDTDNILDFGGRTEWGLTALSRWIGAADETIVPYSMASQVLNSGLNSSLAYQDVAHLDNYYAEPIQHDAGLISTGLHANLKQMIKEFGAIAINYNAYSSISASYQDKIYNLHTNAYYNPNNPSGTNHSVAIVGWDDDFSKTNFATEAPGDGAFLVRNSWREGDGTSNDYSYSGYFWMSYYETSLGNYAYAAEFTTADNYDNNYQYDGGLTQSGVSTNKTANIFNAHSDNGQNGELLKAIGFYTASSNVNYTIEIYTDLTDSANPESGTLASAATTTGTTSYAGQYTINLCDSVYIDAGSLFSVVLTMNKGNEPTVIGLEYSYSYGTVAMSECQSFVYLNKKWNDLYSFFNQGNLCIKAYTDNVIADNDISLEPAITAPIVEIEDLIINSDLEKSAIVGNTYHLSASYAPDNYVPTESIIWSTSTPTRLSVNSEAGSFTVLKPGPCSITATIDGITKTMTFDSYPSPDDYGYSVENDNTVNIWWNGTSDASSYRLYGGNNTNNTAVTVTTIAADKGDNKYTLTNTSYKDIYNVYKASFSIGYVISGKSYLVALNVNLRPRASITYVLNGGTNNPDNPDYYEVGTTTKLYSPTPKYGYKFEGWYLDSSFKSSQKRTSIQSYDKGNLTLYAKYSETDELLPANLVEYTITYHTKLGKNNPNNLKTYTSETATFEIYSPEKDSWPSGYRFLGWYSDSSYYTKVTEIPKGSSGNINLYAQWGLYTYKVIFDGNGSTSGTMQNQVFSYGISKSLYTNCFIKKGYSFMGWALSKENADLQKVAYQNKESIKDLVPSRDNCDAVVTLYAVWK